MPFSLNNRMTRLAASGDHTSHARACELFPSIAVSERAANAIHIEYFPCSFTKLSISWATCSSLLIAVTAPSSLLIMDENMIRYFEGRVCRRKSLYFVGGWLESM